MDRPELLLVDDDPIAIELLSHMLGSFARLRFARSGQEALRLIREQRPALMLLDVDMPGLGGIGVLQQLRDEGLLNRFPVIMITSHRSAELEAEVLERGAADFISKPLTAPQVLGRVQAQLRIQRLARLDEQMPPAALDRHAASILVVDDDVAAIQALKATLDPLVGRVRFATDGSSALQLMIEEPPDLVLLDVCMPGIDGFQVCQSMQSDPVLRRIPIALLTRFADPEGEARGLEMGATDFISKPFSAAVLKARVRNLLRIKRENDLAQLELSQHWQRLGAARISDIVGAASDAIVSIDADGRIVLINAAACALFGVACDSVIGEPASALQGAAELIAQSATAATAAEQAGRGGSRSEPVPLRRADGTRCLVEPTRFGVGNGSAAITTWLLRDVTERERAREAALARLEAEAASRAKSTMLSYIAHEIGNPLNGILGFSQLMAADDAHPLPQAQAGRLENILAAGRQLQSLLREVMDLSRIEAVNFAVQLQRVDAGAAARAAVDAMAPQAALAQLSLQLCLPQAPVSVAADPGRLQQCLLNLLSNAIKYNRTGGAVELTVGVDGGTVAFTVRDTGVGMTADQRQHLFEPFNRLGQSDGLIRGAGLGLVITRALADAMGGVLSADSQAGAGSTFTLRLKQQQ